VGEGVSQDKAEAAKWYRKAADKGEAYAQNSLGILYGLGEGVEKNAVKGLKWFGEALFNSVEI
jgi:TPR repeat protein